MSATFGPRRVLQYLSTLHNTGSAPDIELRDVERNVGGFPQVLQTTEAAEIPSDAQQQVDVLNENMSSAPLAADAQTSDFKAYNFRRILALRLPKDVQSSIPLSKRSGQCCFVCFNMKDRGSFAIQVPCQRPWEERWARVANTRESGNDIVLKYQECGPTENAFECDADIYRRIKYTAFKQYSDWTRYLPFYGVTDVQEVEFRFQGVVNKDGSFPIHIQPLDLDLILKSADEYIAFAAADDDPCCEGSGGNIYHSQGCAGPDKLCIHEQAKLAQALKSRLPFRFTLKDCVQNPETANSKKTLEGMATDSCIYDTQGGSLVVVPQKNTFYNRDDELRGLHITIGWQTNELIHFLPFGFGWLLFAASAVWLCTALWIGGTGNINTGLAFGQLVAASISILVVNTNK